ncbi:MAG: alpha/beta hydrolase [Gemmatimonadaceae bacterium]
MSRVARAALVAMALGATPRAHAQLPSPLPEIAANASKSDPYPAHSVTFANGVKGIPDVVYDTPDGYRPLTLDLYLPPDSERRPAAGFPLVIYIHGGGWLAGNSRHATPFVDFSGVLASLAARGYVVASINYRLSGAARFPAQIQDTKSAIRWLGTNASKWGIDPKRSLAWGVSAGGHLAALAAVSCGQNTLEPQRFRKSVVPDANNNVGTASDVSDCVQGAVAWYGVFDMSTITAQAKLDGAMSRADRTGPEWELLGCFGDQECTPAQLAAASPVTYVNRTSPPMLLIVGSADKVVPREQTLEMSRRLDSAGVKHELIEIPEANHSLIGTTPQLTRDANLKALSATFSFIDKTIGKPDHH